MALKRAVKEALRDNISLQEAIKTIEFESDWNLGEYRKLFETKYISSIRRIRVGGLRCMNKFTTKNI